MMNFVRCGHAFSNRGPMYPARTADSQLPVEKPRPTEGDTSSKKLIFRPIPPNDRTTKDWATFAWPTNKQSPAPDGKFGPARQMDGWRDCWFLAPLEAVANDNDGHKLLAKSIKKVKGGYNVTFKGLPKDTVFVSDADLQQILMNGGGDADARLMELAADKFFKSGNFKSLHITASRKAGMNQERAEQCFQDFCRNYGIQAPVAFNPMRVGICNAFAFFMFTGMFPQRCNTGGRTEMQVADVMRFLDRYVINDRDGTSVVIASIGNPLGAGYDALMLIKLWDVIRTEIKTNGSSNPRQREQQLAFLNALNKWLETRDSKNMTALKSASENLKLTHPDTEHLNPELFAILLERNQSNMSQEHFKVLQSGVQEVLGGGPGYIGFAGGHAGTIKGINEAENRFTYSETNFPTMVHTGELSALVQEIRSGNTYLNAFEPKTGRDGGKRFDHAGTSRGRHLKELYNQVVGDGKIDPAEIGPLANLLEMDDGAFRHVYDSDKNGVIEGGELKALKLRVDRWADHFELTPIW